MRAPGPPVSRSNPYARRGMMHLLCRRKVLRPRVFPLFPPAQWQQPILPQSGEVRMGGQKEEERGPVPFRKLFPSPVTDGFSHRSRPTEIHVLITGSNEQFLAPRVFLLSSSHARSLVVHLSGSCRIPHCLGGTSQGSQENKETILIRFLIFTHFLKNRFFFLFWFGSASMEIYYLL